MKRSGVDSEGNRYFGLLGFGLWGGWGRVLCMEITGIVYHTGEW